MILYVTADYISARINYKKGDVIEVAQAEGARLLADSPGCFSTEKPVVKEVKAPPKDKAVKKPTTRRKKPAVKK